MTTSRSWHPLPGTPWDPKDHCLGFFDAFYTAGRVTIPHGATVLEVGCAEADWVTPFKTLRPDLDITCMDQRKPPPRPGADRIIRGNVLDPNLFAPQSFDVVIAVSVIEHVGIGRYQDPLHDDGDTVAMANIHQWIKPDGVFYMDVPYRREGPSTPFRQYNEADLQRRVISGWKEIDREVFDVDHPDAPYIALVLKP